jgi:Rap1a immunity proteins
MVRTMKNALVAASAACALASPAPAVETSNFNLATTSDLVALCSCQPDDPLYAEALQFCYGYMAGVAQLHRVLVRANDIKPVACPQHEVTREALVRVFLDWARANPGAVDELPAESVKRAAVGAWPCGS